MKILLNCFKNLDKQVKELFILAQSNKEKHIKGEKQLLDLTESINFMTRKIDDYEKDRAEKGKLIKDLREELSSLRNEHEQLNLMLKTRSNTLGGTVPLFTVSQRTRGRY